MALSLHAEYLLGYLVGAKGLAPRDVVPFARIDPADLSTQTRALVKSLAMGVTDGRSGHPVRDATDLRARVLALLGRENSRPTIAPPAVEGEAAAAAVSAQATAAVALHLEEMIEQAIETA